MNDSVGSREAKAHLPRRLSRVARGDRIVITKRGVPVAVLVPPPAVEPHDVAEAVRAMKRLQDDGPTLGGSSTVRDLIEEGRR